MSEKSINLELSELADGGLQEKLDMELKKVFDNIQDLNTEAEAKRKIQITLEFKPDENREVVNMVNNFKTTLAPILGVATTVLTGRNANTGQVEANELMSRVKGQMYLDTENGQVKTDTGVPAEEIEKQEAEMIDFQKIQKGRGQLND